jgi:hypothetical protein
MAEDSETLKVRMLRISGQDETTQWFEYRPSFLADLVRISWELNTMDVELDSPVADYLLRAGYAAPLPQGSAPAPALSTPAPSKPPAPVQTTSEPAPWEQPKSPDTSVEDPPPPPAPSWLKPNGGTN